MTSAFAAAKTEALPAVQEARLVGSAEVQEAHVLQAHSKHCLFSEE